MDLATTIFMILFGVLFAGLLLFLVFKLVWGNIQRKKFIDVDVYHVGDNGYVARESFNCLEAKVMISNEEITVLRPLFSSKEFDYRTEFIYPRSSDRKRCMSIIEAKGNYFPFLPAYVLEFDVKKVIDKKTGKKKDRQILKSIMTGIDRKNYDDESVRRRAEDMLKSKIYKYAKMMDGGTVGGLPWQIIVAGILIIGMVGYFIWKYSSGA